MQNFCLWPFWEKDTLKWPLLTKTFPTLALSIIKDKITKSLKIMEKEKIVVSHEITMKMLPALSSIKSELLSKREMMLIVYLLNDSKRVHWA